MGERTIRRLERTKRSGTSLLLEITGEGGKEEGAGFWYQTHRVVGDLNQLYHQSTKTRQMTKSSSSSDSSSSSSSSTQAPSGLPQDANDQAQAQTNSGSQPRCKCFCCAYVDCCLRRLQKLIRSSTPTKRAAEPTTLDVPPQASLR